jgi:hypothetical protein
MGAVVVRAGLDEGAQAVVARASTLGSERNPKVWSAVRLLRTNWIGDISGTKGSRTSVVVPAPIAPMKSVLK